MKRKITLTSADIRILVKTIGDAWEDAAPIHKKQLEYVLKHYFGCTGEEAFKLSCEYANSRYKNEEWHWNRDTARKW